MEYYPYPTSGYSNPHINSCDDNDGGDFPYPYSSINLHIRCPSFSSKSSSSNRASGCSYYPHFPSRPRTNSIWSTSSVCSDDTDGDDDSESSSLCTPSPTDSVCSTWTVSSATSYASSSSSSRQLSSPIAHPKGPRAHRQLPKLPTTIPTVSSRETLKAEQRQPEVKVHHQQSQSQPIATPLRTRSESYADPVDPLVHTLRSANRKSQHANSTGYLEEEYEDEDMINWDSIERFMVSTAWDG